MDPIQRLASSLPRGVFVLLCLVVAVILIFLLNPPHSVCDSQEKIFIEEQTPFLYLDKKKPYNKTTGFKYAYERCFNGNNLGSCAELFSGIQDLMDDVEAGNPECHQALYDKNEVKKALEETMALMVRLAWGNQPPKTVYERQGWFNSNHMFLFCNLNERYRRIHGKKTFENWREKTMNALPNPNKIAREEIWRRSIFSISCRNF